jgi:hypothetical protein
MLLFGKYLAAGLMYYGVLAILIFAYTVSYSPELLSKDVLLFFDAVHYQSVSTQGYETHFEVAFFPLFPFLWKFLGLSLIGVCVFNAVLYISCLAFVARIEKLDWIDYFIALALPSAIFYFIPYSEALYFSCSVLILYGMRSNNFPIQIVGIVLCSFCRPILPVLLPAIFLWHFICRSSISKTIISGSAVLSGTLLAFFVHWMYTGNFLSYFTAFNTWDYNFKFPLLPLTSGGGGTIRQLDGYALLFGGFSILLIIRLLQDSVWNRNDSDKIFSLAYLSFFALLIISLMRGGRLDSMNRFIFCSPYFILAFFYIEKNLIRKKGLKSFVVVFIGLVAFSLLFESYVHIQTFLKYASVALILSIFLAKQHLVVRGVSVEKAILLTTLVATQVLLFGKLLNGHWIG